MKSFARHFCNLNWTSFRAFGVHSMREKKLIHRNFFTIFKVFISQKNISDSLHVERKYISNIWNSFQVYYSFFDENILYSKLVEIVHFWTKYMSLIGNYACLSSSFLHFISWVFLKQHQNIYVFLGNFPINVN